MNTSGAIFKLERAMQLGRSKKQITGARVHSIAALLKASHFAGSFDVAGASYKFTYSPAKAEVAGRKLQLEGRLTVTDAGGRTRTQERVKALLAATQGGIGTAPSALRCWSAAFRAAQPPLRASSNRSRVNRLRSPKSRPRRLRFNCLRRTAPGLSHFAVLCIFTSSRLTRARSECAPT